ncbi:MAG: ribosome maturation factor RimM [Gammaproteobacteria bacterium]
MSVETGDEYVAVGRISGIYGVKGWVKVYSYTRPRQNILNYSPWYLKQGKTWQPVELQDGRVHGEGIVAHLVGCNDRDAARELLKTEIAITRQQLPELEDGYYWADLIGCRVVTQQGDELGQVTQMLETGANDVLVAQQQIAGSEPQERLIPFILEDVIVSVDISGKVIIVDWDPEF